ncbi:MAG: phosphotransferase [Candidatus Dormibacteria bacterium]
MSDQELPLVGGDVTDGLVRVGNTVRRPRQGHSKSVAAYLRHLQAVGFTAAPRHLGVDVQGRDILDYIDGDVPSSEPEAWSTTDHVLVEIARFLRRLHDASSGFVAPPGARWFGDDIRVLDMPTQLEILFDIPELVTHCDVTPQNVVFRQGVPVGIIDFDLTRPTTRLLDVINTAMHWVPLTDPDDRAEPLASVDAPARLRAFVTAYGLSANERSRFLDLANRAAQRSWHRMRANSEQLGGGWRHLWDEGVGDRILRRRDWLTAERVVLEHALR